MKKKKTPWLYFIFLSAISLVLFIACANSSKNGHNKEHITVIPFQRKLPQETKDYWYDGTAELSSYSLVQTRYGETHKGTAVLVYVTEPFSKTANTKADNDSDENTMVLKMNKTLKFNTGIYPYSMMNSTFFPLENGNASLKIASSLQEWCGMTYLEMKNEEQFIFNHNSYFEGVSFKNKAINKTVLEDDLWSLIRLNPELLPTGSQYVIPSMIFLRFRNKAPKAYKAIISFQKKSNGNSYYNLKYPELERELTIEFTSVFPYEILGWEETHYSGFGDEKKLQTSKAKRLKTVKTDYWNKNHNKDTHWREKLKLQ